MNSQTIPQNAHSRTPFHHSPALDADRPLTDTEARNALRRFVAAGSLAKETPRGKRERIAKHYNAVIKRALSALGAPDCAFDLITSLLVALGDNVMPGEWYDLTDAALAAANIGQTHRMTDRDRETLIERAAEKYRKQRRSIRTWQERADAPEIILYDNSFDRETGRNRSRYQIPVIELFRDIIEDAPVGSPERRLAKAISDHASAYLESYTGTARRSPKRQKHSPESDLNRAGTLAGKAAIALLSNPTESCRDADIAAGMAAYTDRLDTAAGPEISAKMLRFSVLAHARKYPHSSELQALLAEMQTILTISNRKPLGENGLAQERDALTCGKMGRGYDDEILDTHSIITVYDSVSGEEEGSQGGTGTELPPAGPSTDAEPLTPPVTLSAEGGVSDSVGEALRAVDAFASVGVEITSYLFKNDEEGEREGGDETTTGEFAAEVEELITDAELGGVSFIAHLRGPVLQVDDVTDRAALEALRAVSFLQTETSLNRFQTFIALESVADAVRVRERLFQQLAGRFGEGGGNPGPSSEGDYDTGNKPYAATRFPGSINAKPGRDGWRVRVSYAAPGCITTAAELDAAGLLAPVVEPKDKPATKEQVTSAVTKGNRPGRFPDYGRSLSMARRKEDGTPDRSHADWLWATLALKWGWSIEATETELLNVSDRGKGRHGGRYARRTVRKAARRVGA